MAKFPADAPKRKVVKALEILGFRTVREKEHISMVRENPDGSKTPLTMPSHPSKSNNCAGRPRNIGFMQYPSILDGWLWRLNSRLDAKLRLAA